MRIAFKFAIYNNECFKKQIPNQWYVRVPDKKVSLFI